MTTKITFKEWVATFFKGIWQALCWVGRAFNPKNKTPFWRVVWAVITVCIVTVTGMLAHSYYKYEYRHNYRYSDMQRISANLAFVKAPDAKTGIIKNFHTGEIIAKETEDLGIVATLPNHLQVAYDFDGTKSDRFLCRDLEKMYYDKDEWDDDGNKIIDATTLMRYRMSDGYEGLCTING